MKVYELLNLFEDLASKIEYIEKAKAAQILKAFEADKSVLKGDVSARNILDTLGKADPSKDGSVIQWIANMYTKGQFKLEDVSRIKDDITKFLKFKSKIKNKDLNSYKSLSDLYDAISEFKDDEELELTKRQQSKQLKNTETITVIDTPNFKAIIPLTKEASQKYGAGTKWCTASDKNCMFDEYHKQGNLIIIIAGEGSAAKKFQLHYESDSFMDDTDQPIDKKDIAYLSGFPQYKELLDKLIKKHYFDNEK